MSFLAILLTLFLEQQKLLGGLRSWFNEKIEAYTNLFTSKDFESVREIRLNFIYAIIPFLVVTVILMFFLYHKHHVSYFLINCFLFILCSDLLSWKEEAKQANPGSDFQQFVQTYATRFFATTFWFVVLPSSLGAICYLALTIMGKKLREKGKDSVVYTVVVDKMLFWLNVVPYTVLFVLIAAAGDFEEVMHYVLEQKKNFKLSFYFLETVLNEVAFIAIGKDKFKNSQAIEENEDFAHLRNSNNLFNPKVVDFVVALLYRSGIFFILAVTIISLVNLI